MKAKERFAVGAKVRVKTPGINGVVTQLDDSLTVMGEYWHTIQTERGDRREPGSNLELIPTPKTQSAELGSAPTHIHLHGPNPRVNLNSTDKSTNVTLEPATKRAGDVVGDEEIPYPVLAVTDLAKDYSTEHFRFAIKQCRDAVAKTIAEDNRSDQQIGRVRILSYLDLQLSRADRWADDEADLMASVLRSLIELRFWADFISKSPENATRFLEEASIDGRELFERLERFAPPDSYKVEFPLPEGKRVNVAPSGERESLLWKMCSKLVHPSSWVINDLQNTILNSHQRKVLALYVLSYGWGVLTMFHDIVWE